MYLTFNYFNQWVRGEVLTSFNEDLCVVIDKDGKVWNNKKVVFFYDEYNQGRLAIVTCPLYPEDTWVGINNNEILEYLESLVEDKVLPQEELNKVLDYLKEHQD